jgi:hypothetical protein
MCRTACLTQLCSIKKRGDWSHLTLEDLRGNRTCRASNGCEAIIHRNRDFEFVVDVKFDEHGIKGMFVGRKEEVGSQE